MSSDEYLLRVEGEQIEDVVMNHEERISQNEEFRFMAKGALLVLSAILGTGFGLTVFGYIIGLV